MSPSHINAFGWICVVFLGACCLIWLADVIFGIVKDPEQKKQFNKVIGGTLMAGIVGFVVSAVLQPSGDPEPPEDDATEAPAPAGGDEGSGGTQPPDGPEPPAGEPTSQPDGEDPTAIESPEDPSPSSELLAWAEGTLKPRPFLDAPLGSTYPDCAAELRAGGAANGQTDEASECFGHVQSYNNRILLPFIARRAEYLADLESRSLAEPNYERWQYMTAQYASYSYGEAAEEYERMDDIFECDSHLMINLRDYSLFREGPNCPEAMPGED